MNKLQEMFIQETFDKESKVINELINHEQFGECSEEELTMYFEGAFTEKEIIDFVTWGFDSEAIAKYIYENVTNKNDLAFDKPYAEFDKEVATIQIHFFSWNGKPTE